MFDRTIDQLTIFSCADCCGKRLSTLNSESAKVQKRSLNSDRQSLRGAVIRMFDNNPSTENFPNLYPHGVLNQANTVHINKTTAILYSRLKVVIVRQRKPKYPAKNTA